MMRVVKIKIMKQYNDWEEIDKDTNGLVNLANLHGAFR